MRTNFLSTSHYPPSDEDQSKDSPKQFQNQSRGKRNKAANDSPAENSIPIPLLDRRSRKQGLQDMGKEKEDQGVKPRRHLRRIYSELEERKLQDKRSEYRSKEGKEQGFKPWESLGSTISDFEKIEGRPEMRPNDELEDIDRRVEESRLKEIKPLEMRPMGLWEEESKPKKSEVNAKGKRIKAQKLRSSVVSHPTLKTTISFSTTNVETKNDSYPRPTTRVKIRHRRYSFESPVFARRVDVRYASPHQRRFPPILRYLNERLSNQRTSSKGEQRALFLQGTSPHYPIHFHPPIISFPSSLMNPHFFFDIQQESTLLTYVFLPQSLTSVGGYACSKEIQFPPIKTPQIYLTYHPSNQKIRCPPHQPAHLLFPKHTYHRIEYPNVCTYTTHNIILPPSGISTHHPTN